MLVKPDKIKYNVSAMENGDKKKGIDKMRLKKIFSVLALTMMVSLTACGRAAETQETTTAKAPETTTQAPTTAKQVELSDIHEAVKAVYGENYIPSMPFDAQYLSDVYGITEDMYDEMIAEGPMMSAHVDTFVAFKAKEGQADAIEEKLTAYRDYLLNDAMQYPMNLAKIEASQVVKEGDYVFFVMLGYTEEMENEDLRLKELQESNQLAVDTIKEQLQ